MMLTEKRRVIGLFEPLTLQWEEAEYPPHSLQCEAVKWEQNSYSWKMTKFNRGGPTGGYRERFARP
jgi:hypothetical protein